MARLSFAPGPLCACVLISSLTAIVLLSAPVSVSASAANDAACLSLSSSAFGGATLPPVYAAAVLPDVCASIWAEGLNTARGMLTLPGDGGLIIVSRSGSSGSLVWLNDSDSNGSIDSNSAAERNTLATVAGLNHGIALWQPASGDPVLLASRDSTVFRWTFSLSNPSATLSNSPASLVVNMPAGGHATRTITIDPAARWLYVACGSDGNVDSTPVRSGLWRFDLTATPAAGAGQPYDWNQDGVLFAGGLRNEAALTWDREGTLWGAENGADQLYRADLGGDIHNDNPGEEINKFDVGSAESFFGYPYCFSEFALGSSVARGPGAQWAWPQFMNDGVHNDSWCRDLRNVVPPRAVMPAHVAPLGMKFYARETALSAPFAFPAPTVSGEYLIVAQHGSWNRSPPAGYRVVRFPTAVSSDGDAGVQIVGPQENVFWFDSGSATGDGWGRPVDVALGRRGEVFVSDDSHGRIIVLRHLNATLHPMLSSTGGGNNGAGAAAAPIPALFFGLLVLLLAAFL